MALMREAVSKSGPAVDVEQDIRDLAGRQQRVGGLLNFLSLGWRARLHRRDDQLSAGEVDAIELALIGEPRHLLDFAVERRPAAGEIAFHVCQIASNCDPLFASNRAPSPALVQACPGSEQEGPARS